MRVRIGIFDGSSSRLANDALIESDRVVFTDPSDSDRKRARWSVARVVSAPVDQAVLDREDGVAVISAPVADLPSLVESAPDPVVIAIVPSDFSGSLGKRVILVRRYPGCVYSVVARFGHATVTELSRPPAPAPAEDSDADADPVEAATPETQGAAEEGDSDTDTPRRNPRRRRSRRSGG